MSEGLYPGKRLRDGRYRLLSKLRAGATAQVWRALDARDGVEVAIKAVPTDAGGADAVEHEAEAVARVQHPGAVRVLATFEEADHGLIVMELAAGSLADRVDAHGPLDGAATRAIGLALAEVLAAAHAAGVVHRDVKPQNVLVMADGSVRLADFGIARVHARGHTRTGALLGTLPFMAPEQRRDARDVRPATDIYALAALIAWMRTGVMPGDLFVPEVIDALRARLLAAGEPDDALLDVIVAAGRYAPAERIADGARMAEALRGVGRGGGAVARGGGTSSGLGASQDRARAAPERSPLERRPYAVALLVVAGAAVAAAVGSAAARLTLGLDDVARASESTVGEPRWCDVAAHGFSGFAVPGPRETVAVTVADVDDDGSADALYMNQLDESISIAWGRPEGPPTARSEVPATRSAFAPEVVDLDGDGTKDIVVAGTDSAAFAVIRGLGKRAFQHPSMVPQAPSPQQFRVFPAREGPAMLLAGGGLIMARHVVNAGVWPSHRVLTPFSAFVSAAFALQEDGVWVALGGERPERLFIDTNLVIRQRDTPRNWPTFVAVFAADLQPGKAEELYAITEARGVLRLPLTDEMPCRVAPDGSMPETATLAHMDGDSVPDLVSAETCPACTSSQAIRYGQPG